MAPRHSGVTDSPRATAILDFPDDAYAAPVRRVFATPSCTMRAISLADVVPTLDAAERLAREGRWVVGFVAYEASPAFDPAIAAHPGGPLPLAWFAAFDEPIAEITSPFDIALNAAGDDVFDPHTLASAMSDAEYGERLDDIRELIAAGDVYQVNLTVPFSTRTGAPAVDVYERMRRAQGGRYSAYLDLGGAQVLSASPELFLRRCGTLVRSRPMKGTARRGLHAEADDAMRAALRTSEKERAENVMIVDVVRNDLGRVARLGSVRVAALCEPERYPSVWQLTSTVDAEVDRDVPLSSLFRALFPPASVTGAPKIRATGIIVDVERVPRGVYCGAVGVIRPGGDATFNVAIRTATMMDGVLRLNAGGGVTIDSTARGELAEVRAKVTAFTVARPRPTLFETIRVERGAPLRLERHLARLAASADYFALPYDATRAEALARESAAKSVHEVGRLRLTLDPHGAIAADVDAFEWRAFDGVGARIADGEIEEHSVVCAAAAIDRDDLWLHHKTTFRNAYEKAAAAAPHAFDVILWNGEGEATELTRGNLVAELDGVRWTPPLDCGLLAGTLRGELLESKLLRERVIPLTELRRATRLWFINALRGWVPITLTD
jgi:para-aminobenzoate synthetase/4-amino-4-deoxychorismate lyase